MLSVGALAYLRTIATSGLHASYRTAGIHASLLSTLLDISSPSGTCSDDCKHPKDISSVQCTVTQPGSDGHERSCQPLGQSFTSPAMYSRFFKGEQTSATLQGHQTSHAACRSDVSRRQLHTSCAAHAHCTLPPSIGTALRWASAQPRNTLLHKNRSAEPERQRSPAQLLSRRLAHTDPTTAKRVSEANSLLQVHIRTSYVCTCM
jgi:hypothetical protein